MREIITIHTGPSGTHFGTKYLENYNHEPDIYQNNCNLNDDFIPLNYTPIQCTEVFVNQFAPRVVMMDLKTDSFDPDYADCIFDSNNKKNNNNNSNMASGDQDPLNSRPNVFHNRGTHNLLDQSLELIRSCLTVATANDRWTASLLQNNTSSAEFRDRVCSTFSTFPSKISNVVLESNNATLTPAHPLKIFDQYFYLVNEMPVILAFSSSNPKQAQSLSHMSQDKMEARCDLISRRRHIGRSNLFLVNLSHPTLCPSCTTAGSKGHELAAEPQKIITEIFLSHHHYSIVVICFQDDNGPTGSTYLVSWILSNQSLVHGSLGTPSQLPILSIRQTCIIQLQFGEMLPRCGSLRWYVIPVGLANECNAVAALAQISTSGDKFSAEHGSHSCCRIDSTRFTNACIPAQTNSSNRYRPEHEEVKWGSTQRVRKEDNSQAWSDLDLPYQSLVMQRIRSVTPNLMTNKSTYRSGSFPQQSTNRKEYRLMDNSWIVSQNSKVKMKDDTGSYMDKSGSLSGYFEQGLKMADLKKNLVLSNPAHSVPTAYEREKLLMLLEPWGEDENRWAQRNYQQSQLSNVPMVAVLPAKKFDPNCHSSQSAQTGNQSKALCDITTGDQWNPNDLKNLRARYGQVKCPDLLHGKMPRRAQDTVFGVDGKLKRYVFVGGRLVNRSSSESPISISHANTEPVKNERKDKSAYGVVFRLNQQNLLKGSFRSHRATSATRSVDLGSVADSIAHDSNSLLREHRGRDSSRSVSDTGTLPSEAVSRRLKARMNARRSCSSWQNLKPDPVHNHLLPVQYFFDLGAQRQLGANSAQQSQMPFIGSDSRTMYYNTSITGVTTRRKSSLKKAGFDVNQFFTKKANRINPYRAQTRHARLSQSFDFINTGYWMKNQDSSWLSAPYRPGKLGNLEVSLSRAIHSSRLSNGRPSTLTGHKELIDETDPFLQDYERSISSLTPRFPSHLSRIYENARLPRSSSNDYVDLQSTKSAVEINGLSNDAGASGSTNDRTDELPYPKLLFNLPVEPLYRISAAGIKLIPADRSRSSNHRSFNSEPNTGKLSARRVNMAKDDQAVPIVIKQRRDERLDTPVLVMHRTSSTTQHATEATDFGLSTQNLDAPYNCPNDREYTQIEMNDEICQFGTQALEKIVKGRQNTNQETESLHPYDVEKESVDSSGHAFQKKNSASNIERSDAVQKTEPLEVYLEDCRSLNKEKTTSHQAAGRILRSDITVNNADSTTALNGRVPSPVEHMTGMPKTRKRSPTSSESVTLGRQSNHSPVSANGYVSQDVHVTDANRENVPTDRFVQNGLRKESNAVSWPPDARFEFSGPDRMNEYAFNGPFVAGLDNQQFSMQMGKGERAGRPSQQQGSNTKFPNSMHRESNSQSNTPFERGGGSRPPQPPYGPPVPGRGSYQCPAFMPYNTEIGVWVAHQLPICIPGAAPVFMSAPNPWLQCTNAGMPNAQPPPRMPIPTTEAGRASGSALPGSNSSVECMIRMAHGSYPMYQSTPVPLQPVGVPSMYTTANIGLSYPPGAPALLGSGAADGAFGPYASFYSWIRLTPPAAAAATTMRPSLGLFGVRASQHYQRQSQIRCQLNALLAKRYSSLTPEEKKLLDQMLHELGAYNPNRDPVDQAKLDELLSKPYESLTAEEKWKLLEILNKPIKSGQQRLTQMKAQLNALLSRPPESLSPEEKQTLNRLMREIGASGVRRSPAEEARLQALLSKPYEELSPQERQELANLLNSLGTDREIELEQMRLQLNDLLLSKSFDSLTTEEKYTMLRLMRELGEYDPNRSSQDQAMIQELLSQPYETLSPEQKRLLAELLTGSPEANEKRRQKWQAELDDLLSKPFESLTSEEKAKLKQLRKFLKPGPNVARSDSMELKLAKLMAKPFETLTEEEKELLEHLSQLPRRPAKYGFRKFRTPSMEAELAALLARNQESLSPMERERLMELLRETQPTPKNNPARTPSMEVKLALLLAKPYESLTVEEKELLNYLTSIPQASAAGARLRTKSIQDQIQRLLSRPYESLSPAERELLADLLTNTQPAENILTSLQALGRTRRTKSMEMQFQKLRSIPYENLTQEEKDLLDYLSSLLPKNLERTPSIEEKFLWLSSQPLENLSPEDRELLEELKQLFCEHSLTGRQKRTQSQEAKLAWLLAQPSELLTDEQRREMLYLLTLDGPDDDVAYDPLGVSLVRTLSMEETLNRLRAIPFDQLTPEERELLITISRLPPAAVAESLRCPEGGWPWVLKVAPPTDSPGYMRAFRDMMSAASEHFNGLYHTCQTDYERYPPFIPYPGQALYFNGETDPSGPQIHFWPWSMGPVRESQSSPVGSLVENTNIDPFHERTNASNAVDSNTGEYKALDAANNCELATPQAVESVTAHRSRSMEKKTSTDDSFGNTGAHNSVYSGLPYSESALLDTTNTEDLRGLHLILNAAQYEIDDELDYENNGQTDR